MSIPLRPLKVTEILDGAFTLYRRHLGLLVAVSVVYYLVPAILGLLVPMLGQFAAIVLSPVRDVALIWIAAELIRGSSPTLRPALGRGAKLYIPTAVMGIAYSVVVGLAFFVGVMATGLSTLLHWTVGLVVGIGATAGFLWLFCSWFAWRQLIVVENDWNFFRRSTALASGQRRRILVVVVLGWLLVVLPTLVLTAGQMLSVGVETFLQSGQQVTRGQLLSQFALDCVTRPLTHLLITLMYFDTRVRLDGLDVEQYVDQLEQSLGESAGDAAAAEGAEA